MKATLKNMVVEGTPKEIVEFIKYSATSTSCTEPEDKNLSQNRCGVIRSTD
ncbi:hypothetical protein [Heyndrickxia oleronia]|uniref:hypothetical protein n=1 Tax=Heyndrickxia oleronia TaxID=38875 RepID=UPI001C0EA599|nr:hypothetical protein [Heyndrickxia oleronia]MBU5214554.1 hypothetical protein [Heyndrickxia oleronia]